MLGSFSQSIKLPVIKDVNDYIEGKKINQFIYSLWVVI